MLGPMNCHLYHVTCTPSFEPEIYIALFTEVSGVQYQLGGHENSVLLPHPKDRVPKAGPKKWYQCPLRNKQTWCPNHMTNSCSMHTDITSTSYKPLALPSDLDTLYSPYHGLIMEPW